MELQLKHGYMFFEFPIKEDRFTMQLCRDRKTGKSTLTPALKMGVVAPDTSWLAKQLEVRQEALKKEKPAATKQRRKRGT